MSAVAALFYPDGRPVAAAGADQMLRAMSQIAPGRRRCWDGGSVALGHRPLESLPPIGGRSQSVRSLDRSVLVADVRLDNREELARMLELSNVKQEQDDSSLMLRAYQLFGEDFVQRLVGDFAFALWDGRRRVLLCARDRGGVRQLYYYKNGDGTFAVASAVRGLLALPGLPRRLDERRLAEFIESPYAEVERTFYRDIGRVPPAQLFRVDGRGVRRRRYWALDPHRELRLGSDGEYEEAFKELFVDAVRVRLRASGRVACELSGGLDSSAVACVAERLASDPLPTYSVMCRKTPGCDERRYIRQVLCSGRFRSHEIDIEQLSPLGDLEDLVCAHDEPPWGPNAYLPWAIYREASRSGISVMLGGLDGDTVVSHGVARLADLAVGRRWTRLSLEVAFLSWRLQRAPWSVLRSYVVAPLAPPWVRSIGRRIQGRALEPSVGHDILRADFRRRVGLDGADGDARSRQLAAPAQSPARAAHHRRLVGPIRDRVIEMSSRSSLPHGIELRHPFEDHRLKEFCLALPADQRMQRGWPRSIVRRSLDGLLPSAVQRRVTKADFGPAFVHGIRERDADRVQGLMAGAEELLGGWLDVKRLLALHRRCIFGGDLQDLMLLFRVAALLVWLRKHRIEVSSP